MKLLHQLLALVLLFVGGCRLSRHHPPTAMDVFRNTKDASPFYGGPFILQQKGVSNEVISLVATRETAMLIGDKDGLKPNMGDRFPYWSPGALFTNNAIIHYVCSGQIFDVPLTDAGTQWFGRVKWPVPPTPGRYVVGGYCD